MKKWKCLLALLIMASGCTAQPQPDAKQRAGAGYCGTDADRGSAGGDVSQSAGRRQAFNMR